MHRALTVLAFTVASAAPALAAPQHEPRDILATAAANGSFDTLVSLVVAAGLEDALQEGDHLTVFAPTDEAFAALPDGVLAELRRPESRERLAEILSYHVLPQVVHVPVEPPAHRLTEAVTLQGQSVTFTREGSHVRVDDANVVERDLRCSNGIVQVIDRVLIPPPREPGLIELARADGRFGTLLAAVEAADLVEALSGEDELTLLAPTDEAFSALPDGVLAALLAPENKDALARVLTDHVLPGDVSALELAGAGAAKALSGSDLPVGLEAGSLTVAGSRVLANDLEARNGRVHVIDRVIVLGDPLAQAPRPERVEITGDWRQPVMRNGVRAELLVVSVAGGGSVKLTGVDADVIETRVAGGGRIELAGRAGSHRARVSGGGVLAARGLRTHETDARIHGGGDATLNASQRLAFRASAGARVRYVDTGAQVEADVDRYATVETLEG